MESNTRTRVPMDAIKPECERYDSISDVNYVFCIQTAATVLDYNFGMHCTAAVLDSAGRLSTAASEAL